jgi:hypothetical protein
MTLQSAFAPTRAAVRGDRDAAVRMLYAAGILHHHARLWLAGSGSSKPSFWQWSTEVHRGVKDLRELPGLSPQ